MVGEAAPRLDRGLVAAVDQRDAAALERDERAAARLGRGREQGRHLRARRRTLGDQPAISRILA